MEMFPLVYLVIIFFLVTLLLLIVAEIRRVRFRLRFLLLCITPFYFVFLVAMHVFYSYYDIKFESVMFQIRNKVLQNDIQSVKDAFRDFDFNNDKVSRIWALDEALRLSSSVTSESGNAPYGTAWERDEPATLKEEYTP